MEHDATGELTRWAAFTDDPAGGNPAGVWRGDRLPAPRRMQQIAAEVGFSETAFCVPTGSGRWRVRYFSPEREIDFCGHATIAAAVSLHHRRATDGDGDSRNFVFDTLVGPVPVRTSTDADKVRATLTSVEPDRRTLCAPETSDFLAALGWDRDDLDPALPVEAAYAGAWHLVVPVGSREIMAALDYDFDGLRALMLHHALTTVQACWRASERRFFSRNPFPVGGVVEDPATGAAAAALGGYLRLRGEVSAPVDLIVHQGDDLGRPSRIDVHVPTVGGIDVSGGAVPLV